MSHKAVSAPKTVEKKKVVKRCYSALAIDNHDLLQKTFDFYTAGTAFLAVEWLRMMGGFEPKFAPEVKFKYKKEKVTKEIILSPSLLAFSFWFVPQSGTGDKTYRIEAQDLKNRFLAYWGEKPYDPVLDEIFATAELGLREDAFWTDQRKNFICNGGKPKEVEALFKMPKFILWKDGDSDEFVNSLISMHWKDDKKQKTDYDALYRFMMPFKNKLESGISVKDALPADMAEKHRNGTFIPALRSLMGGKKGRTSNSLLLISKAYHSMPVGEELEALHKSMENELNEARYREEYPLPSKYIQGIRNRLLAKIGLSECKVSQYFTMFSGVLALYRSWRSNFLRHVFLRCDRKNTLDELMTKQSLPCLEKLFADYKAEKGQKFLNNRQFRGIHKLLDWWEDENAVTAEERQAPLTELKGMGDNDLLGRLAKVSADNALTAKNIEKCLDTVLPRENANKDYLFLRNPCFTMPNEKNPHYPRFSETMCKVNFAKVGDPVDDPENRSDRNNLLTFTVELFNGKGFEDVDVKVAAGRLFNEIRVLPEGRTGLDHHRSARLVREALGREQSINPEPISLQLYPKFDEFNRDKDRWYFNVSVTVLDHAFESAKTIAERFQKEQNVSVLGIDLGQRDAVAFAHLKTDNAGDFVFCSEKSDETLSMRLEEAGTLNENFKTRDGRIICRLSGGPSVNVSADEKKLWDKVTDGLKKADPFWRAENMPATRLAFAKNLAYITRSLVNKMNDVYEAEELVNEVADLLGARWKQRRLKERKGMGALSFSRLEYLTSLKCAYQSVNSKRTFLGMPASIAANRKVAYYHKRIVAIRNERVRISANLIVRKALSIGALLIIMEDLKFKTNQSFSRNNNRRLSDWCAIRIAELVEEAGKEHGIIVRKVSPQYTSMEDIFTKENRARFDKGNVANVDAVVKRVKNALRNRKGKHNRLIYAFWEAKKKEHATKDIKKILLAEAHNGEFFYPCGFGKFFPSSMLGWVDSDIHASINIALRGLQYFFGWKRPIKKTQDDTEKTQRPTNVPDLYWSDREKSKKDTCLDLNWRPSRGPDRRLKI